MNQKVWLHQTVQPINRPTSKPSATKTSPQAGNFNDVFQKMLDTQDTQIKFSTHAMKRMSERGIKISETDVTRLNEAIENVSQKGAKDALVMLNKVAYVVSVNNKTVVTAMDEKSAKDNVFTNIDSAIII